MANYTLHIDTPILTPGAKFKVRLRTLPGGSFGVVVEYTTQDILFTGLAEGQYEAEIIYNDGTGDCSPSFVVFTAHDVPDCWVFTAEIMTNGIIWWIRISWVGALVPTCGYKFYWSQGGASGMVTYMSGGVPLDIIVPNSNPAVLRIAADDCFQERDCVTLDVVYSGGCSPIVITGTDLDIPPQGNNNWQINIHFNQSTPRTTTSTITTIQTAVNSGFTPGSSILPYSPSLSPTVTASFKVFVQPGSYTGSQPTFSGTLTDACGQSHSFTV